MPFKPNQKTKTVEGVVNSTFNRRGLAFDLKDLNHRLFYLQVEGARVDSGEKVKLYLMGDKIHFYLGHKTKDNDRSATAERIKALEILDEDGNPRFTYISDLGPHGLGSWEW